MAGGQAVNDDIRFDSIRYVPLGRQERRGLLLRVESVK